MISSRKQDKDVNHQWAFVLQTSLSGSCVAQFYITSRVINEAIAKGRIAKLSDESDFDSLGRSLSEIAEEITKLSSPGLLEAIGLASPFLFDESEDGAIQLAIERIKDLSGLGPFQKPIQRYLEICIEVDSLFVKKRCRSDRRAKKFLTLQNQLDSFLKKKITAEVFALRIHEQVLLLKSLQKEPSKSEAKKEVMKKTEEVQNGEIPEGVREFLLRKTIQILILATPVSALVYFITASAVAASLAFSGCALGILIGILFELLYYYAFKDTSLQRFSAYIVLAAYVTIFVLIAGFYLEPVYLSLGYLTDVILLIALLVTELVARWGPLNILEKAADYIQSGMILLAFYLAAQFVSILIGETVWVAISVISAFYTIYSREKRSA